MKALKRDLEEPETERERERRESKDGRRKMEEGI